jgi:hypothetical protein
MTPQKRRLHLIDKHMYPKNFFFALTKAGIDGRKSLLLEPGHRRRKQKESQAEELPRCDGPTAADGDVDPPTPVDKQAAVKGTSDGDSVSGTVEDNDVDMEGLAGSMSALRFVPTSIRFGRRSNRTGFSNR